MILLTIVLVISLVGCGDTTAAVAPAKEVKLLTSEDLPYRTALVHRQEEDAFEVPLISYEFLDNDMVRIIGQRQATIGDKVHTTNYDFLVYKSNVTFYTMDRIEE